MVKHTLQLLTVSGLALFANVACQGDVTLGRNDSAVQPGGGGDPPEQCEDEDAGPWSELLRGEWSLEPGEEAYVCVRKTLTEDGYIQATRGIHSLGTHNASLYLAPPDGPDGTELCPESPAVFNDLLLNSGPGANTVSLPAGQALPVQAGQQLILRVDVLNTSVRRLSGEAIQLVRWLPASEVTAPVSLLDLMMVPNQELATDVSGGACEWTTAMAHDWSVSPGSESYECVRQTLTHDVTFHEIQSVSPAGTHSLVLSAGLPTEPDGIFPCDWESVADQLLIGSIQGTHRLTALEGHGVTVPAGYQLLLNLHLVNTTFEQQNGAAVVQVR